MNTLPIVLAHGIFRLDQLRIFFRDELGVDVGPHYFNGIRQHLASAGFQVRETDASFAGPLALRARQLREQVAACLAETGAQKVHIIAHSMGGLDARRMIVDEDMADHVATLTTIGTPHHGTALADVVLKAGGKAAIAAITPLIDLAGFNDLTTRACLDFNQRVRDAEATNSVRYRAVWTSESLARTSPLLQAAWIKVKLLAGASDGVVPRSSQEWDDRIVSHAGVSKSVERIRFPLPADHLNEIGWWDPGELLGMGGLTRTAYEQQVREFYLRLARTS
ncbi:MAG TPA: alpha/beta fold hydrolase [Longimicrobiaceae bacterium]|jgi:triacylglycerol lipase